MTIKHKRILLSIAAILLTGLSGCGSGQLFDPTATPMASSTTTPTPLPTPTPTRTPRPTRTPTPTPVPAMRTPISSATWEVTVIGAGSRTILWYSRIGNMLSGWKPKPGNIYLDLAVRIRNLNPSAQRDISQTDLTVTDGNGNDWSVFDFGVAEAGEGKVNPQAIAINQCGSDLCMSPDVVVRLIYVGPKDAITAPFILQFEDVPLIEFEVEGPVG